MHRLLALAFILTVACSCSSTLPPRPLETEVEDCSPLDHLKCMYQTGLESYLDGRDGNPSRHYFRWSYIGLACKKQLGSVGGGFVEGLFIIPHYIGVGAMNTAGLFAHVFSCKSSTDSRLNAQEENHDETLTSGHS